MDFKNINFKEVIRKALKIGRVLTKDDEAKIMEVCYQQYTPEDFKLVKIDKGDWIDVRAFRVVNMMKNEEVALSNVPYKYSAGDVLLFKLGFSLKMPKGYEGRVLPRSSTFKNYGFILTNSEGVIDNSYNGTNDEWCMMVYCMRDGEIALGERIGQFRITKSMPKIEIKEVKELSSTDRGGYGTTGVK